MIMIQLLDQAQEIGSSFVNFFLHQLAHEFGAKIMTRK
jgi:hypothetical protein